MCKNVLKLLIANLCTEIVTSIGLVYLVKVVRNELKWANDESGASATCVLRKRG